MRFLTNKPINTLKGTEFIVIYNGHEDKLIEMKIELPKLKSNMVYNKEGEPELLDCIEENLIQLYQKDLNDQLTAEWNYHRKLLVLETLNNLLYPQFVKKLTLKLIEEAEDGIIEECRRKFRYMIQQGKL
jgi:transcriptional accessory protein Tex/SPT6